MGPRQELEARLKASRWRNVLPLLLSTLYVAVAAVVDSESRPSTWLWVVAAVVVSLLPLRKQPSPAPRAEASDSSSSNAERRSTAISLGLTLALATAGLTSRSGWEAGLRAAALAVGARIASKAIAEIEADAGLAGSVSEIVVSRNRGLHGVLRVGGWLATFGWGSAALIDLLAWSGARALADGAPLTATLGGVTALLSLGGLALAWSKVRGVELGATPKLLAVAATCGGGLVVALVLAYGLSLRADAALAVAAAFAHLVVLGFARARDVLAVAKRGRRAVTLILFGGPVVALAALTTETRAVHLSVIAIVMAAMTMVIGTLASRLEEPLLPARGQLLDAFDDATRTVRDRGAEEAIADVLVRIREAFGQTAASPQLWILHPTRLLTVDTAGYLHEREGELPTQLLDVAASEPDGVLRVDVLHELEVRRADLRPLLQWLEGQGAVAAVLIGFGAEPDGVLLVPAGTRSEPLSFEEVRAAHLLARSFVAVCQTRSARTRHLARERELAGEIEHLRGEAAIDKLARDLAQGRHELATARLARPATVGIYSAASRMAYDALERRIETDRTVAIVARSGIDPVPYMARAHLNGPRKHAPFVVVDGTSSREHDPARWSDPAASPLALADRGLLFLVDGAALPHDVQTTIVQTIVQRRGPWEGALPTDIAIALSGTSPPADLATDGRLSPALFNLFGDAEVVTLPGLRERPEDLFSIVADRLAREGLRVHGRPIGIDAAAFALLVEHPFDGEDPELDALVSRLVARVTGDVIRAADLESLGFDAPRSRTRTGSNLA